MNRITKLIITFAVIICVAFVSVFAVQNKDKIKDLFVSDADRFLQLQKDLMDYQDIVKTLEKDVADMETTLDDLENIKKHELDLNGHIVLTAYDASGKKYQFKKGFPVG